MLDKSLITAFGDELYAALRSRKTISPFSSRRDDITVDDAYYISLRFLERRLADGEKVVGKKIGVTSKPVQDMLNVHQPDFGFLTNAMEVPNGATVSIAGSGMIQPRAEGEIAFILAEDLNGPGVTAEDVLAATEYVAPCFEIVDSRIHNWEIRIQDTVADNASCGIYVIGAERVKPAGLDLANVRMDIIKNGQPAGSGLGSAVQGHPCTAVAWLANTLGKFGIPFKKGEAILSGSLAPLIPITAGDRFSLTLTNIGSASIGFEA
ncbi:MAG: 2-oxopent-4-enoate hydratase [Proteobacteria bacterium]|nr:2-oxopent-4-enoate hydratase [Pseudomonadota bacterium]HQR03206.1 2-oxopent-4-enoate hydratase [Rhodocyclaceae bacterium]